mgnify:CR=1 FL=1|jgi:hypothetical protein|tara:strand:- start:7361 stop:7957 length:597 start_codon:yes stop_codon:yes gene_type:complete
MAKSLFDTLQANAFRAGVTARTKSSRKWFEKNVQQLKMPSRNALLKDDALDPTSKEIMGSMYMYFYDPKHKKTLPYYDRFPLTIMLAPVKGGFQGLNLHYLEPSIRAKFLDELMKLAPSKIGNNSRLTKLRYDLLQSTRKYKEFRPCFKTYLTSQIQSRMVRVPMTEWEIAVFLPTEQFKKSGKQNVWKDSLKIARQQ